MKKKVLITVLCVLFLFIAAGCSSSATESQTAESVSMGAAEAPAVAEDSAAGEYGETYDEYDDVAMEPEEAAGDLGELPNVNIPDTGRKLIYSSSFEMETKQFDNDYTEIKKALAAVDGYVENENTYADSNEYGTARYASMTLRVPIGSYNDFLDTVSSIGTVQDKQITTEDISDQYFDTESRIEILENRQARLMEHLESATKMEDIITLESELSDVLYELDQYKGSKRGMDDLVDFARVYVNLNEVISAETITSTGDPLGERAANAYNLSLTGVGQFLQDFAVGLAAAAPVLMLLAVIAVIIFAVIKLCRFLRKKWIAKHGERPRKQKPPFYPGGNMPGNSGMPPQGYQQPPQNGTPPPPKK